MGGTNWSDMEYSSRASLRASTNTPTFAHTSSIASGATAAKTHDTLCPTNMKAGIREARDSDAHPNSCPIFVGLDVTGSMRRVPEMMQKKLVELMGLLQSKGYVEDPAICVAGIGDARYDRAPFQVGQFESGIEIEDDLTNLYLEGRGGGNFTESYELALYFLARCVNTDAWEKRGRKGYAFIIGDEGLHSTVEADHVRQIFGEEHQIQADIPVEEIMQEVLEKWELFCIVPNMTQHFENEKLRLRWDELLEERVLYLDDPEGITELLASTMGLLEDNVDDLVGDLVDAGLSTEGAESVSRALANVGAGSNALANVQDGTDLTTL